MKQTKREQGIQRRRQEILSACEKMLASRDYQDINLKSISEMTELSRPSLYNYFQTKEEILLALTESYLLSFTSDIEKRVLDGRHDQEELTDVLTEIVLDHFRFVEILSVHMTDIETHVPLSSLVRFKSHFKDFVTILRKAMLFQFPDADGERLDFFWMSFVSSLHGIFPMTTPSQVQREAMARTGILLPFARKEFIRRTMRLLLSVFGERPEDSPDRKA